MHVHTNHHNHLRQCISCQPLLKRLNSLWRDRRLIEFVMFETKHCVIVQIENNVQPYNLHVFENVMIEQTHVKRIIEAVESFQQSSVADMALCSVSSVWPRVVITLSFRACREIQCRLITVDCINCFIMGKDFKVTKTSKTDRKNGVIFDISHNLTCFVGQSLDSSLSIGARTLFGDNNGQRTCIELFFNNSYDRQLQIPGYDLNNSLFMILRCSTRYPFCAHKALLKMKCDNLLNCWPRNIFCLHVRIFSKQSLIS